LNTGYTYTDIIDTDAEGETVLGYYTSRYTHSTKDEWLARIMSGQIKLDGESTEAGQQLSKGQRLTYEREAWTEPDAPRTFDVLYEDEQVIAVNKPSGLPVLPGGHHLENTLLSVVRERYGGEVPPSPLHRLGRGTSGIVLFARNVEALRSLSEAFQKRSLKKVYRALVVGTGLGATFRVETPIGKIPYAPTGELFAATSDGKPSTSICTTLWEDSEKKQTLLDVEIITGRPHQIRIHTAASGHPLVGDPLYDAGGIPKPLVVGDRPPLPGDTGYHLHARLLEFEHPASSERIVVEAQPPDLLRIPEER
jgi:23S rRNA pseudouridine1911/1915/1917 synthase